MIFRAYDDGVALRYRILSQESLGIVSIKAELTGIYFPTDYDCWGLNMGKFNTEHEGEFHPLRASMIRESDLFDLPLVCRTESTCFAIAQADLANYPGMGLSGRSDGGLGAQVEAKLAPGGGAVVYLRPQGGPGTRRA